MRRLVAALLFAAAPLAVSFVMPVGAVYAATVSELGDLSALSTIATDTLTLVTGGDLVAAEHRITDFESAWDKAAGTMQPLSPTKWRAVDVAADGAIESLRAAKPDRATIEPALAALIAQLDNPGGDAPAAAAPMAAPAASTAFAVTNADGSPLPCEVGLKTVRDAATSKKPSDQGKFDEAMAKGLERCNADDDKRADGFFADAFALLQ